VAISAPETIDAIFRAAWQQDVDISDAKTLGKLLDRAGFDGNTLVAQGARKDVKLALRKNTQL
jgi:2-hydroxychromene-2-carboxylate isomerase